VPLCAGSRRSAKVAPTGPDAEAPPVARSSGPALVSARRSGGRRRACVAAGARRRGRTSVTPGRGYSCEVTARPADAGLEVSHDCCATEVAPGAHASTLEAELGPARGARAVKCHLGEGRRASRFEGCAGRRYSGQKGRLSRCPAPSAQTFGVLPIVGATGQFRTCPGRSSELPWRRRPVGLTRVYEAAAVAASRRAAARTRGCVGAGRCGDTVGSPRRSRAWWSAPGFPGLTAMLGPCRRFRGSVVSALAVGATRSLRDGPERGASRSGGAGRPGAARRASAGAGPRSKAAALRGGDSFEVTNRLERARRGRGSRAAQPGRCAADLGPVQVARLTSCYATSDVGAAAARSAGPAARAVRSCLTRTRPARPDGTAGSAA